MRQSRALARTINATPAAAQRRDQALNTECRREGENILAQAIKASFADDGVDDATVAPCHGSWLSDRWPKTICKRSNNRRRAARID
jgi:hypothetical protein